MSKAKQNQAQLTHTEIICYAIRYLDGEIGKYKERRDNLRDDLVEMREMLNAAIQPLQKKKDILAQLYQIETGTEYNQ